MMIPSTVMGLANIARDCVGNSPVQNFVAVSLSQRFSGPSLLLPFEPVTNVAPVIAVLPMDAAASSRVA